MIKAVIFDVDDTLVSESSFVYSGYNAVATYLSPKVNIEKGLLHTKLIEHFKKSPKNVFNRFFDEIEYSYNDADIQLLIQLYRSHTPTLKPYEDVDETLIELRKKGFKLGIITDGFAISQNNKLKVLKLRDYVDKAIVTDELGREFWKPHPRAFELMKNSLGVEYEEMIYVGDNPTKDFYIRSVFPIYTVRINRSEIYNSADYLEDIKEHYKIDSLHEIFDVIKLINNETKKGGYQINE